MAKISFNTELTKKYYNLTKPGIIYGNLLTAVAGFLFASHWHIPYVKLIGLVLGLGLVIGGACSINNVIDRGIDAKMERTKKRALVTGDIKPRDAVIYGLVLATLGSVILGLMTNLFTMYIGLFGMVFYLVIYGLAKRNTVYSTAIGAVAGAVPPLGGYIAFTDTFDTAAVILFLTLVCWQLSHFYAIALYRKKDYKEAGLPIWPIVRGDWSTQVQSIAFIGLFTVFSVSLFIFGYAGYLYLLAVLAIGIGWLWFSLTRLDSLSSAAWGKQIFKLSLMVILGWSVSIALGPILP